MTGHPDQQHAGSTRRGARCLTAGCDHVLARTARGRVLAWGDNGSRQLGDGTAAMFRRLPVRVKLPAGVTISSVASGPMATFSLAIG